MTYAILGAAGATGKAIAQTLTDQGLSVRLVGRSQQRLQTAFAHLGPRVTYVAADLETPQGAALACQGIHTAIVCLGLPYNQFARYPALMRILVQGAIASGVERMLLISNVYPYGLPQTLEVREDHPREPNSFKGRMRLEQEEILLAAGKLLQPLVLRLPDFLGAQAELSYTQSFLVPAIQGQTAYLLAPSDLPHQFVYVPDVGPVVARLLETPAAWGGVLHFAGSQLVSVDGLIGLLEQQLGRTIQVRRAGLFMIRCMGLFSMVMRELVEMHYLMTNPLILNDERLVGLIGEPQRTSHEQALQHIVQHVQQQTRHLKSW